MNDMLRRLGKRIAELRSRKGFTQENFAEMLDYSPNHISKLESGRTNPSFDLLVKISNALKTDLNELFEFKEYQSIEHIKTTLNNVINSSNEKDIRLLYSIYNYFLN